MPIASTPRIRVVVLNYDGGEMTLRCLDSLRALDVPADRLEVVLVDNASIDGIVERVREHYPWVRLIESFHNTGFSGGCNLGIGDPAAGEYDYVALLNNDALAEPGWLGPLVDTLEADPGLGAAASKMLFAERFWGTKLTLEATFEGRTNPAFQGAALTGMKVDGVDRWADAAFDEGFWGASCRLSGPQLNWSKVAGEVRIGERHVSEPPRTMSVRLNAVTPRRARLATGAEVLDVELEPDPQWFTLALPSSPSDVVNNAGSCLFQNGSAGDRGFLQRDDGQFDEPEEVFAWCGGAVLLRASYLVDVGVFDDRFFLYYEDTDLSWRGRLKGWRYAYVPTSVVRHEHAATSGGEGSSLFRFYVDRNRLLTLAKSAPMPMVRHALRTEVQAMSTALAHEYLGPLRRGRRPRPGRGRQLLESMRSAASLTKEVRAERAALRAGAVVDDADIMGWVVTK